MDIDLEKRTKVSRACDYCKKRKFKCSGISPCELCTKKGIECQFSIIDRRTIRRKNKKRTVKPKPSIGTLSGKISKDDDQIDKKTLKMLTKKSKIPLKPLLTFPLHKVDTKISSNDSMSSNEGPDNQEDNDDDDDKETNGHTSGGVRGIAVPSTTISNMTTTTTNKATPEKEDGDAAEEETARGTTTSSSSHRKVVIEERDPPKVLYDSDGNLRYVGESSPLSFLFECRNIFAERIGPSKFTSESDSLEVIDEPDESIEILQVALPSRLLLNSIIKIFYTNIQQACYFVNIDYFKSNIIDPVYENYSESPPDKIALLNLVISLGLLFAECTNHPMLKELQSPSMNSAAYFEFGFYLTKKHMNKGKLWITEAFSLAFCYYQAKQQRNTAWLMLGMAIRNAQALGLHRRFINESFKDRTYIIHRRRLFKTLYILDRITSVLLGRPLIIDDYDWDDFDSEDVFDLDDDGKPIRTSRYECMIQSCKICKLTGKVVRNFYLDGIINPYKAEKLAIELKLWSLNLPEDLQIDKVFITNSVFTDANAIEFTDQKMPLLIMHLSQLYAIVLLCRPFFMYLVFKKKKKKNILKRPKTRPEVAMCNFCKATAKSSALIIQLVENYINSIQFMSARAESHGLTHACFMAALIIGLSLLYLEDNGYTIEDGYSPNKQMNYLNSAKGIFEYYAQSNPISSRFYNIIEQMQQALMTKFNLDIAGNRIKLATTRVLHSPQDSSPNSGSYPSTTTTANTTQPYTSSVGDKDDLSQDLPFNEDYDNFIDNFGNMLPMATMKQSMTNNIPYLMNAQPYQTNGGYTREEMIQYQQQLAQNSPDSDTSSSRVSNSSPYVKTNGRTEPLDAFMYSVGLNDILYDTR
ncbi:LOW QUALITY PROTEIN: FGR27 Filamentous growth regulator 27 [Candida maltosa Xu316]